MIKKVDEQFSSIKDIYVLQCICTELNDKFKNIVEYISENIRLNEVKILSENCLENKKSLILENDIYMNILNNIFRGD